MRKKIVSIIITFLVLFTFPLYAEAGEINIQTNQNRVMMGNQLVVDIFISSAEDIAGGEIILNYDSSKFQLNSKEIKLNPGSYFDLQGFSDALKDSQGSTKIVFGLKGDKALINGNILLGRIIYKAKEVGDALFSLDGDSKLVKADGEKYIYEEVLLGDDVLVNVYKRGSISGKVALDDDYSPKGAVIKLYRDEVLIDTTNPAADGSYSFEGLEDGEYIVKVSHLGYQDGYSLCTVEASSNTIVDITLIRIKEDVNRDGEIGIEDLVFVGNLYGLKESEENYDSDADVNDDDIINLLDLISIARAIE